MTERKIKDNIQTILEQTPFWNRLTQEQQVLLAENSKVMEYEAGDSVYSGARECLGTFLILELCGPTFCLTKEKKLPCTG